MASLLQQIGNFAGGAFAQLNPFDNGENFNSYMQKRKREEQQAQQAQQARPPQQRPQVIQQQGMGMSPQQRMQQQMSNPFALPQQQQVIQPKVADVSKSSVINQTQPQATQPPQQAPKPIQQNPLVKQQQVPMIGGSNDPLARISQTQNRPVDPNSIQQKASNLAKTVVAGAQQAGGSLLDAAIQGGEVASGLLNPIVRDPFISPQQRDKLNIQRQAVVNQQRNAIHGMTDVTGRNIDNRSTDMAADRLGRGQGSIRDLSQVVGRAVNDAGTATAFVNPTRVVAGGAAQPTLKQSAPFIAREAGVFGGANALGSGAQTYGETGDIGESVKQSAIGFATGALPQVGLEVAAHGLKRARTAQPQVDTSTDVVHQTLRQSDPGYRAMSDQSELSQNPLEKTFLAQKMAQIRDRDIKQQNIPANDQTVNAFSRSTSQRPMGQSSGVNFEMGSFGDNALARKANSPDRITSQDIQASLPYIRDAYRADNNPLSYRSDNVAWVAEMPDGTKNVIYTRKNVNGAEEIINAHKIGTVPNYEDRLASFGTPAQSRTGGLRLRTPRGESAPRERGAGERLATSESSLHDIKNIANNIRNVKSQQSNGQIKEATNGSNLGTPRQSDAISGATYEKPVSRAAGTREPIVSEYTGNVNPSDIDPRFNYPDNPKVSQGAPRVGQQSYKISSSRLEQPKLAARAESNQMQRQPTKSQTNESRIRSQHSRAGQQSHKTLVRENKSLAEQTQHYQPVRPGHLAEDQKASGPHPNSHTPYEGSITDKDAKRYIKQMGKEQDAARKSHLSESRIENVKASSRDTKVKLVDDLSPIIDRKNRAIKDGANINPENDVEYQIDRSRRSEGIKDAYIRDHGLAHIIEKVPSTKEFDQYLIARHAAELDPEVRTGRDKTKDAALVKKLDKKYSSYAKELYKYNQKLLDTSTEYGLLSKEVAKSLKKRYPEYVPFNRIFNEDELSKVSGFGSGNASLSKQGVVKKIKGSKRVIDSPLDSIIDKTRVVIEQGERNAAAKTLAEYRKLPGNPFNLREIPKNETIGARHTISYLDRGVKRTFETDKEIADAAKNLTREQIGLVGNAMRSATVILRGGATTMNTAFAASNVWKDLIDAFTKSRHGMRIADPEVIGKALAATLHQKGEAYGELMREGVSGTFFDSVRNPNKSNVSELRSHRNVATRALHNAHPKRWMRTTEDTIGRSETFGRALQYYSNKKGFEKKYGRGSERAKILAADQARTNSTNFQRYGSWGKNINAVTPYWNAGIQGARTTTRRMKERPLATVAKITMSVAAPSIAIAVNNYSNEKKRQVIDNIPQTEKDGNIVIVTDNAHYDKEKNKWDGVWKIPVPPSHLGIHQILQEAVKQSYEGSGDISKGIGKATENYTGVNLLNPGSTAGSWTPQIIKLGAEPATNTNFYTGNRIVPESMKNLDTKDQVDKNTSLTAKKIGDMTGWSPMQVDNFIRTATAGAGQNAVNVLDQALVKAGYGAAADVRGRDLIDSVTGRFYGAKGTSAGMQYYQSLDKAAADNKLSGKDLTIFNSLADSKLDENGDIQGKTERDALNKYQNLAAYPRVAKAISDAAKSRAEQTGSPIDPLYNLDQDKQMAFYNIKAQNRNSAEQEDLINKAGDWYQQLSKQRSAFFKTQDIQPAANDQRVKYPQPSETLQAKLDAYYSMDSGDARNKYLENNPDISEQFTKVAKYTNDVRKAQGVAELRDYPQASDRVQKLMSERNFKDPEVAQYLQDMNVYKIVEGASLARFKGNDLNSKTLKAIQSTGKYNIVKNPDGTLSLKYKDTQGGGTNDAQAGAVEAGGFGPKRGGKGGRKRSSKVSTGKVRSIRTGKLPTSSLPNLRSSKSTMKKLPLKQYSTSNSKSGLAKIKTSRKTPPRIG